MHHLYRTAPNASPAPVELSSPLRNLDVRQRGINPFFSGLAVGVAATLLGVLLGLFLFLPI